MLRKLTALTVIFILTVTVFGCRKKPAPSTPPEPNKTEVKTLADFNAQATKDINSANMQAELEKLEKDIEKESGTRP